MKMKNIILAGIIAVGLIGCAKNATPPMTKSQAYPGMYKEAPLSVLIMLPINKTNQVEAKEFFYTTLTTVMADQGYYVMPPFMSQDVLRRESANDAERFVDVPLNKFGENFGVDAVLFTTIHKWKKDAITDKVETEVEYVLKSTKTNEILFQRKGDLIYDTTIKPPSGGGLAGLVIAGIASKVNTAATSYIKVSRMCNYSTISDMPAGKYRSNNMIDSVNTAGLKEFKRTIGN